MAHVGAGIMFPKLLDCVVGNYNDGMGGGFTRQLCVGNAPKPQDIPINR